MVNQLVFIYHLLCYTWALIIKAQRILNIWNRCCAFQETACGKLGLKTVRDPMSLSDFVRQCSGSGFSFTDRDQAEQDPTQKQVIPYILLQSRDREMTAVYCRKGSEKRLHDLWSAGIGGHINPEDRETLTDFKGIVLAGMARELDEELVERPKTDQAQFLGVISEESSPVSAVHIGAVFRIETSTPQAYTPGPELHRFQWMNTKI